MRQATRSLAAALILTLGLGVSLGLSPATRAQDDTDEAKAKAREARIEEYLRKREERQAQRELERQRRAAEAEQAAGAVDLSTFSEEKPKKKSHAAEATGEVVLPPDMARVQEIVRSGPLGKDPSIQAYLDLIDKAEASPHQLAAFGNYLESSGWPQGAIVYYEVALDLEPEDPILWLNAGTLYRKLDQQKTAIEAYHRTLSIDPNNARAHYNLGAIYDEQGKYEDAIEEYKVALLLDPALGDPATNPQVAHNERLVAVKLMLYQEKVGTMGLPLADVPGGEVDAPAQPAQPAEDERH